MHAVVRKIVSSDLVFYSLYILGLVIAIPLSLVVWFIRRELFVERFIAGDWDVSFYGNFLFEAKNNGLKLFRRAFFAFRKIFYPESV
jgi:hypothetical protein